MERELDHVDPRWDARSARLRYVSDTEPGISRVRVRGGFKYLNPDGTMVTDPRELNRISDLRVPPAWKEVWICTSDRGHLQATGRDARGRKQYRYHKRWRQVRDETKFSRMGSFGGALALIRSAVERDLALPGMPREKVLALVTRLLESTLIRVGNDEYARTNGSYGLTTMHTDHVDVSGSTTRFVFRGKGGKPYEVSVRDRRLARIVTRCRELDGHVLFQYLDDEGVPHAIDSGDVNAYLREISGHEFTAKDIRT